MKAYVLLSLSADNQTSSHISVQLCKAGTHSTSPHKVLYGDVELEVTTESH